MKWRGQLAVFCVVCILLVGCGKKATPTPAPMAAALAQVTVEVTRVVEKVVKETVVVEREKVITATAVPVTPALTNTPAPTSIPPTATPQPTPTFSRTEALLATLVARGEPVGQVQAQAATQPITTPVTVSASLPVTVSQSVTGTWWITSTIKFVPDPARQPMFPDVPFQGHPALASYEQPFEDGDYFEAGYGDVDLPQFYYRIVTAGRIKILELGIDCEGSAGKGCAVVLVNHYGPTAMWRRAEIDNGFTVAGQCFDMSTPEKVTLTGQALLDHVVHRMTVIPNPGTNCSTQNGCPSVEWHVVIVGDGKPVAHWTGLFRR